MKNIKKHINFQIIALEEETRKNTNKTEKSAIPQKPLIEHIEPEKHIFSDKTKALDFFKEYYELYIPVEYVLTKVNQQPGKDTDPRSYLSDIGVPAYYNSRPTILKMQNFLLDKFFYPEIVDWIEAHFVKERWVKANVANIVHRQPDGKVFDMENGQKRIGWGAQKRDKETKEMKLFWFIPKNLIENKVKGFFPFQVPKINKDLYKDIALNDKGLYAILKANEKNFIEKDQIAEDYVEYLFRKNYQRFLENYDRDYLNSKTDIDELYKWILHKNKKNKIFIDSILNYLYVNDFKEIKINYDIFAKIAGENKTIAAFLFLDGAEHQEKELQDYLWELYSKSIKESKHFKSKAIIDLKKDIENRDKYNLISNGMLVHRGENLNHNTGMMEYDGHVWEKEDWKELNDFKEEYYNNNKYHIEKLLNDDISIASLSKKEFLTVVGILIKQRQFKTLAKLLKT